MKVLQVVPSLALRHGGVSVSVRELCRGLASLGTEVEVWSTPRGYEPAVDEPEDERLRKTGVRVRYFPVSRLPWAGRNYAYSPSLGRALRQESRRFDLLHLHSLWLYPTLAAASAGRRLKIPYLLSPCGALDPYSLSVRRALKRLYLLAAERRNLQGASAVHFTSEMELRRADTFGVHFREAVIPRSLELGQIPDVPPARRSEWDGRKILLFLGRLHPKKRLDLATAAFADLCKQRNDVHFVIAGPDEGSAATARRIAENAGILDRVTFLGLTEPRQRWALFKSASLFLLPSEDENFGMAALEAMAVEVPVLLSDQVGLSQEVSEAKAGLVLDGEIASWSGAARLLLEHPEIAEQMGRAGRKLVETKFSTRRVASRMNELYGSLLVRRS